MAITGITAIGSLATKSPPASGGSTSFTLTSAVAVGDAILIMCAFQYSTATTLSCTDSAGNTYTRLDSSAGSSGSAGFTTFACNSVAAMASGTATVTITVTGTLSTLVVVGVVLPGADAASATEVAAAATTATYGTATGWTVGDAVVAFSSVAGPTGDVFTQDTTDTVGGSWATILRAGTNAGGATSNTTLDNAGKVLNATGNILWGPTYGTNRTLNSRMYRINAKAAASQTPSRVVTGMTPAVARSSVW